MTNIEKDKELLVRDLGIFELRGLARQLGVSSPTTKKREQLIEYILKAMESNDVQENVGKRKGRPFKKLSSIKDILSSVVEGGVPYNNFTYGSMLNFAQVSAQFDAVDKFSGSQKQFTGFARVQDGKVSFIDCERNVWVFVQNDAKYCDQVRNGDKIVVNGYATSSPNQFIGVEIVKINDKLSKEYQLNNVKHGFELISNNVLPFGKKNIREGRRNSLCLIEELYENDSLTNTYKYCQANGIEFVLLGANVSFEDSIYFKTLSKKVDFTTQYGSNDILNLNKLLDAINYTSQMLANGKNVLLVVSDIMEIVRLLDRVLYNQAENREEMKKVVVTELLSLAKAYDDGSACSMLVCYRKNDYDNSYLQSEVLRICKEI